MSVHSGGWEMPSRATVGAGDAAPPFVGAAPPSFWGVHGGGGRGAVLGRCTVAAVEETPWSDPQRRCSRRPRARARGEPAGTGNEAMKTIGSELLAFARRPETRQNVWALLRYLALLAAVIAVYAVLFHVIMVRVEGREYSWYTGVYWTLTVMTTLGFGDITFESDLGRAYSTVVLLTGMVLLLIVLPFLFIRYFYAPWWEEQISRRAQPPDAVPPGTRGHVVVVKYDSVAAGLIDRLGSLGVPCFVLEGDPEAARRLYADGVPVVLGSVDSRATYEAVRVKDAALVLANDED